MTLNNVYANFAIARCLRAANPQPIQILRATGKNWFLDPVNGLARITIDHQSNNGSWSAGTWIDRGLATPWSIIILSNH